MEKNSIKKLLLGQWLNDECIYNCILLLHRAIKPNIGFAFFWSNTVTALIDDSDEERRLRHTSYDKNDIWIMSIQRSEESHWALAVVHIPSKTIYHFNSFADEDWWKVEARASIIISSRGFFYTYILQQKIYGVVLLALPIKHSHIDGHSEDTHLGWTSQRLLVGSSIQLCVTLCSWIFQVSNNRLQRNSYDCGVWLLACVAAVLRGKSTVAALSDKTVTLFRKYLLGLILQLPIDSN